MLHSTKAFKGFFQERDRACTNTAFISSLNQHEADIHSLLGLLSSSEHICILTSQLNPNKTWNL